MKAEKIDSAFDFMFRSSTSLSSGDISGFNLYEGPGVRFELGVTGGRVVSGV